MVRCELKVLGALGGSPARGVQELREKVLVWDCPAGWTVDIEGSWDEGGSWDVLVSGATLTGVQGLCLEVADGVTAGLLLSVPVTHLRVNVQAMPLGWVEVDGVPTVWVNGYRDFAHLYK